MVKNPIGTSFKKENIFLATVDRPLEKEEADAILKKRGIDLSEYPKMIKDPGEVFHLHYARVRHLLQR